MKVSGYVRTSTDAPVSAQNQRNQIEQYAKQQGYQLAGVFADVASGFDLQSTGLTEAMMHGDTLLVASQDRISRHQEDIEIVKQTHRIVAINE